jgi:hypothetical protein
VSSLHYYLNHSDLISTVSVSVPDSRIAKDDIHERDSPSTRQRRQSSSSCSGNITIISQSDVDNSPIASCTSFAGDIILDEARGNISFLTDAPIGLTALDGSIYCRNNAALQNLNLYPLTSISGSIVVDNAGTLFSLSGDQLDYVQAVQITAVPEFRFLYIPGVKWLESLEIGGSPMTPENLADSEGLRLESVGSLYIHDCFNNFSLDVLPLQNITESLIFEDNGPNSGINLDILWANNITLRNVQGFSFEKMVAVNNSFEISNSDNLTTIAFESLHFIGGSFYIQNNPNVEYIGINSLKTIGESFVMTDNPALKVPAFGISNALQNVASMDFVGPFISL